AYLDFDAFSSPEFTLSTRRHTVGKVNKFTTVVDLVFNAQSIATALRLPSLCLCDQVEILFALFLFRYMNSKLSYLHITLILSRCTNVCLSLQGKLCTLEHPNMYRYSSDITLHRLLGRPLRFLHSSRNNELRLPSDPIESGSSSIAVALKDQLLP
ncbi:hypothetical protein Tco_1222117, partial [Tanacetum coccineum]